MTYHILKICLKLVSFIPFPVLYVLSDVIGFLLYHVIRYRRKIVRKNLTECFPDKSHTEIARIEKKFYRYFTDNILESFKMASMSAKTMSRRMRYTNFDDVNKVLDSGKSVALFLGHYANWEWQSSMPLHILPGIPGVQIYHSLRNKNIDRLMLEIRGRMGAISVEMRKTARYITEQISRHQECIVGFIADQSPKYREVKDFIPFMHHRTPVLTGVEKIVKHYDFDPWFVKTRKVKRGFYEAEFVHMHDNPKSLPDFELTEIYYRMLEDMINSHPELYLWTHKRFKHAQLLDSNK